MTAAEFQRYRRPGLGRWPHDFRDEVLARLLELNRQCAEQARLTGLAVQASTNTSPKRKRVRANPKSLNSSALQQTLFDE